MLMNVSFTPVARPVFFLTSFKSLLVMLITVTYPLGLLVTPPVRVYWLSESLPSFTPFNVISVASTGPGLLFMTSSKVK